MGKFNFYKSLTNVVKNSVITLLTTTLILLITFNLDWLLIVARIFSRLSFMKNLGKTIFNLESLLLVGNLSTIILFIGFVLAIKRFKLSHRF